jgi:hypothetical protein
MSNNYGHWTCDFEFNPEDHYGFIYQIENTLNGMTYIGQKQFWAKFKRPPLKGKKLKRSALRESDWKKYTGSSKRLNQDIIDHGIDIFKFKIIELTSSKWESNYKEAKAIIYADALLNKLYYNEFLGRIGRCPESLKY